MPGSIRAIRRGIDPIRGRGRVPLSKRSKGHPEFRPTNDVSMSTQERRIAHSITRVIESIPRETVLEGVVSGDIASYGQRVLQALTERSNEIQQVLFDSLVQSGEVAAIEIGRDLSQAYRQIKKADAPLPSEVALRFRFNSTDPRAVEWARRETGALITNMVQSEQEAIRQIVTGSLADNRSWQQTGRGIFAQLNTVTPSAGVREFADTLGSNLNGLTQRYEQAVINRVTSVADDLASRGITGTKALETMRKEGDKYATKLRRARSRTIARTERMRAHNQARLLSFQQAIDSGLASADHSRKQWQTGPFDVCNICVPMQGVQAKVADAFTLPNGAQVVSPPAHPNCRCNMTMVTDVRLYDPPQALGTGEPGDPFRIGQRQFSQRGQELANEPLVNVPRPAVPSQPTPLVDVTPPQPVSQFAIDGIEDARTATAKVKQSRTITELGDNGLTNGLRDLPKAGRKNNSSANGVLNLNLTKEGEAAVDAVLDVGKKARMMLDDELERLSSGMVSERRTLVETQDKLRAVIGEEEQLFRSQKASLVREELQRFSDAMPNQSQHIDLWRFMKEADDVDLANSFMIDRVTDMIHRIIKANADDPAVIRYLEDVVTRTHVLAPPSPNAFSMLDDTLETIRNNFAAKNKLRPGDETEIRRAMQGLKVKQTNQLEEAMRGRVQDSQDEFYRIRERLKDIDDELKKLRVGVLEDLLKANRTRFGEGDAVSKFSQIEGKTKVAKVADVREALRDYARRVPTEWLDEFRDGFSFGFVKRGFYSHYYKRLRVSGSNWQRTLTHEMTHGHQYHSRRIQMFERMYLSRRATRPEYVDSWYVPQKYNTDPEPWFDLGFGDRYTTKVYADGITELSTRASEMAWYGLDNGVDVEMIDYWLGVLLTL